MITGKPTKWWPFFYFIVTLCIIITLVVTLIGTSKDSTVSNPIPTIDPIKFKLSDELPSGLFQITTPNGFILIYKHHTHPPVMQFVPCSPISVK